LQKPLPEHLTNGTCAGSGVHSHQRTKKGETRGAQSKGSKTQGRQGGRREVRLFVALASGVLHWPTVNVGRHSWIVVIWLGPRAVSLDFKGKEGLKEDRSTNMQGNSISYLTRDAAQCLKWEGD